MYPVLVHEGQLHKVNVRTPNHGVWQLNGNTRLGEWRGTAFGLEATTVP